MKIYYLRLATEDFVKAEGIWTSGVIDFYDTHSVSTQMSTPGYRNYSTVKSNYGLDLRGDKTFVGLDEVYANQTELGNIDPADLDRFIDKSGRIDVLDYTITYSGLPGSAHVTSKVDLYTSDSSVRIFPEEWAMKEGSTLNNYIGQTDSQRYGRFVITPTSNQSVSDADVELIIQIRIGEPLQGDISYKLVREMQTDLPEWMAARELGYEEAVAATPTGSRPQSVAGQMLNAVAGEWLDDLSGDVAYSYGQQFITTADLTQVAWAYTATGTPTQIWQIRAYDVDIDDWVDLSRCVNKEDFYRLSDTDYGYWFNEVDSTVWVRKNYSSFEVNSTSYDLYPQHVWNWFDEFGLRLDLFRLPLEDNQYFRARILDTYLNKPGVGVDAFKLALRRELSLWQYFTDATPATMAGPADETWQATPEFLGATPEVLEISDMEVHPDFMTPEGLPTRKFQELVAALAAEYPSTWGHFVWGEATWDSGGQQGEGYNALPLRFDAEALATPNTQMGVGDGSDLYLYRPDEITGPREFTGRGKLRGRTKGIRDEARAITFEVDVWGEAPFTIYDNEEVTISFNYRVYTDDLSGAGGPEADLWYHNFELTTASDENVNQATPSLNSYAEYRIFDDAGAAIPGHTWYRSSAYEVRVVGEDGWTFSRADVSDSTVRTGTAVFDMYGYLGTVDIPGPTDNWDAWVAGTDPTSATPSDTLNYADAEVETGATPVGSIIMRGTDSTTSVGTWITEKQRLSVSINGALPDQSAQSHILPMPTLTWTPFLAGAKTYYIELVTPENAVTDTRGGFTTNVDGTPLFIPYSAIVLNSSATWTSNKKRSYASIPDNLTFSSNGSFPSYPVQDCVYWGMFEAETEQVFEGVVDENGPWRNGIAPQQGNNNYNLVDLTLTRDDFGLPSTDEYIVTWMGVECLNNDRVIVWLDTNTVKPFYEDGTNVEYPDSSIEEYDDAGVATYGPFIVRARLNPAIAPQWHPQIHSGWFYEKDHEYYVYADPQSATVDYGVLGATLDSVPRQGAPIIALEMWPYPEEDTPYTEPWRQVAFWDEDNAMPTLTNTEIIAGNGSDTLYLAFEDCYDIVVYCVEDGLEITLISTETYSGVDLVPTNQVLIDGLSDIDRTYEVTYKVYRSFMVNHDFVSATAQYSILTFDQAPTFPLSVDYEGNKFDPATPVELPLNTFYTMMDEGFVFLSHNEYDLAKVEVRLSPSSIIADGEDYALLTLRSLDRYGNPKPNASFTIASTFGTLEDTFVTTNDDGFAAIKLTSAVSSADLTGYVTITGDVSATVNYRINPTEERQYRLSAVPSVQQIPADDESSLYVVGKVETEDYEPVPGAVVFWRRGRYMKDVWDQPYSISSATPGQLGEAGRVVANTRGVFTVGPFVAAPPSTPGYWMVAMESEKSSPDFWDSTTPNTVGSPGEYGLVGDAVFWVEFPDSQYGVENLNGLPKQLMQNLDRTEEIPDMNERGEYKFPVVYDELTTNDVIPSTPVQGNLNYEPSKWYALPKYRQYQLGLLGDDRNPQQSTDLSEAHPDYRKF